jgi:hypothetical protein
MYDSQARVIIPRSDPKIPHASSVAGFKQDRIERKPVSIYRHREGC